MEEFAIVLPNGDVVLNKINFKGQQYFLLYEKMEFSENGRLRRFFISNTSYIALHSLNTEGQPFSCFFNEVEFDRLKSKELTVSTKDYPDFIFNYDNFIYAVDGNLIRVQKKYIKNEDTPSIDDDQLCIATYNLPYNHNDHAIFKDDPDSSIPFPPNFDYQNNSNCLSPTDTLFSFYKIHGNRTDASGQNIDKKVLMDIAILLEKYRKTDSDFYKFLENNNLINIWNEQNISWADQSALSEFYEYGNQDFINYRNWLEKYYLSFKYYKEKIDTLKDPNDRFFIAVSFFSSKALTHLEIKDKLKILGTFSKRSITDWWSTAFEGGSREHIVLKIIKAIRPDQYGDFLDGLAKIIEEKSTLFQILYEKINGENKKIFNNLILQYWQNSKYTPYAIDGTYIESRMSQYSYHEKAPYALGYRSSEFLGIYKNNFNFKFDEGTGRITAFTRRDPKIDSDGDYIISTKIDKFFGNYSIFQPVSLINTDFESTVKMPVLGIGNAQQLNSLIPIFYLKYIDDSDDWESFQASAGLILDVALTFSGIGNLAKLRHLRNLSRLRQVCAIFGAIDVAVETIDLMFKFATNNCHNQSSEFCKRFQNYLFCLQIVTSYTDAVLSYALRKSAKRLKEIESVYPDNFPQEYINIINLHSSGSLDGYAQFIALIKKKILNRINSSNEFEINHFTNQQLNDLIEYALDLRMDAFDIEGIIFTACRKKKPISFDELKNQMQIWKNTVEPQRYPITFDSLNQFSSFKDKLTNHIKYWGIPYNDIRVQGSSLRKLTPDDVDIAIMLSKEEVKEVQKLFIKRAKSKYGKNQQLIDSFVQGLGEDIDKGMIKNGKFGKLEDNDESFMQNLYSKQIYPSGKKLNISIIIKDGSFDVSPYIKF